MRNILLFIRIYFTFIFFLFLMGLSFYMLFSYNKYHHAAYSKIASEVTGNLNKKYNSIEYYFQLKKTNDSLVKANAELYNKLKQDYEVPDTVNKMVIDTLKVDSLQQQRKYLYMPAKVVYNSINLLNNYIELHRGAQQGITSDMGVIDVNSSVVGTVVEVSNNYAVVMSLLHEQSNLSARLKKGGETGFVSYDGKTPGILYLKDISKQAKINQGDTIVTSGFSDKFPRGLLIGYVKDILNDKSSSTFTIRVIPAANFENLQYAYIINNLQKEEPEQLLKKVKSK
ncbi:MAG TPA: rod shape-determining protein MreC [Hanamia sp.]|jgi:rod shape-determining protein MreC|nr:rod shape-determining protein MreC [Hanamia sp.]